MLFANDRDVRFGVDSILEATAVFAGLNAERILLVCGPRSFESSGAARCLPELESRSQVRRWSDFRANTDAADLVEGLRVVEEFAPDAVFGVGGGSALDMAKLLCAYQGVTDEAELQEAIGAGERVTERALSLVLAPTTSGSGSEATHFAVVYIGQDKHSIAGPAMLPDTVILDPKLTVSASPYQRATSGIDAVAQAVESLWAAGGSETSREYARQALPVLIGALPEFVNDGTLTSANRMAQGAHMAGRAIDVSKTTAAHALSYGITKTYGLPHGHAVALTLGGFIAAHVDATDDRLQATVPPRQHREAMATILAAWDADSALEARDGFHKLAEGIGLSMDPARAGVTTRQQAADLVSKVNLERLSNNPVRFTREQLEDLVFRA